MTENHGVPGSNPGPATQEVLQKADNLVVAKFDMRVTLTTVRLRTLLTQ